VTRRLPPFKQAFIGYHYVLAAFGGAAYAAVEYGSDRPHILALPTTRSDLYISLAATSSVLLGFAVTAVTVFTGLGSGRGMDFLRGTPGFAYTRTVFLGAIWSFTAGTGVMTAMIVADSSNHPRQALEAVAFAVLLLMALRTWALLWLLDRLLNQVLQDAKVRFERKVGRQQAA
jgi:hypothetical protein